MTVLWKQPRAATWNDVGLAVVCRTCHSPIGLPCVDTRQRSVKYTHLSRRELAEAYGFVLAAPVPLLEGTEP